MQYNPYMNQMGGYQPQPIYTPMGSKQTMPNQIYAPNYNQNQNYIQPPQNFNNNPINPQINNQVPIQKAVQVISNILCR